MQLLTPNRFDISTVIFTGRESGAEVVRLTSELSKDATEIEAFVGQQSIINAFAQLPKALCALQRISEKVDRASRLRETGGKISKEDWTELCDMAADGFEIMADHVMLTSVTAAGFVIHQSLVGGYFYENIINKDQCSEEFTNYRDALLAAFKFTTKLRADHVN